MSKIRMSAVQLKIAETLLATRGHIICYPKKHLIYPTYERISRKSAEKVAQYLNLKRVISWQVYPYISPDGYAYCFQDY